MISVRVLLITWCLLSLKFCDARTIARNEISFRQAPLFPSCEIYCYGPLLHTVQMAGLYQDSKTFVDMKLKMTADQTLDDFSAFMNARDNKPNQTDVLQFVEEHFDDVGKEFENWSPKDWTASPKFLEQIADPDLRQWGADLNAIWKDLGRQMTEDVHKNSDLYSIIPVANPVIVPGGRFREFYYWDSYWIIRGLLYSEMYDTARGMVENFLSIVQRFGFIPNGGRIYYGHRSQLPLLTAMVHSYVEMTKDEEFAKNALDILEHEFNYWINNHTIQVKGYDVCVYGDKSTGPRPESYREDVESSQIFQTEHDKEEHYSELKAACESGMDFSSRWYIDENGGNSGNLTALKTRSVVPVELNAVLYWNAKMLSEFHSKAGNTQKAAEYEMKAQRIFEAIQAVHWNEEVGIWLDYDIINNKQRNFFTPANFAPLWVKAFAPEQAEHISKLVLKYIDNLKLDSYPGGVPNTLNNTGEQWDFPNVWPPMQYMAVEGLENLGTAAAKELSQSWGYRWVKSNFKAYVDSRNMYEKYDAEKFGGHGAGGEYEIQKGFGWSNGVIIEFLAKYGPDLRLSNANSAAAGVNSASVFLSNTKLFAVMSVAFVAIAASTIARYLW